MAAAETLLTYQMQPILKQFRQQAPGVKLSIQCENCFRIRDEVLRGAVDLGVHYDVGGYGGSMNVRRLAEFPITLVAAPQRQNETFDFGAAEGRQPIPPDYQRQKRHLPADHGSGGCPGRRSCWKT